MVSGHVGRVTLPWDIRCGAALRIEHPSSDIASQCSLRSFGDMHSALAYGSGDTESAPYRRWGNDP